MLHRIRLVMHRRNLGKFKGHVEVDETFIGGRARFMHKHRPNAKIKGTDPTGKSAVMGLLERHEPAKTRRVKVSVVRSTRRHLLQPEVREYVERGASVAQDL